MASALPKGSNVKMSLLLRKYVNIGIVVGTGTSCLTVLFDDKDIAGNKRSPPQRFWNGFGEGILASVAWPAYLTTRAILLINGDDRNLGPGPGL